MKHIVLMPNPGRDTGLEVTHRVAERLRAKAAQLYMPRMTAADFPDVIPFDAFPACAELILVIGGDGSVLDAVGDAVRYDVPLLAVNRGHLGYLTEVEPDSLEVLDRLFTGEYTERELMLLSVSRVADGGREVCDRLAFNDVIVSRDSPVGIADFSLTDRVGECVRYRADSLIVSTPTGSTAYSLSAGGPIIAHGLDSLLVTPACPHSFFNRSILFPADEVLSVQNIGAEPLAIFSDGRRFSALASGETAEIRRADKRVRLLTFAHNRMFSTLFGKMRMLNTL